MTIRAVVRQHRPDGSLLASSATNALRPLVRKLKELPSIKRFSFNISIAKTDSMSFFGFFSPTKEPRSAVSSKCSRCKEFQQACLAHAKNARERPGLRLRPIGIQLYETFTELSARATAGCQLCRCWMRALLGECDSSSDRAKLLASKAGIWASTPYLRLSSPGNESDAQYFKIWTDLDYGIRFEATMRLGEMSPAVFERILNIGQESAAEWVKAQLHRCEDGHDVCSELRVSQDRPTRLLSFDQDTFRVVDGVDVDAEYAALSYCWGKGSRLRLLRENEEQLRDGLPIDQLEKTVSDAVRFCLALGIHHLWLDALCIFQDADGDWEVESAKIGHVYGNARLTLSICTANAASEGFIHDAEEPISHEQSLLCGQLPVPRRKTLADIRRRSAVSERGWIYQEELLSPRILYWSDYGVFWSCTEQKVSQSKVGTTDELFPHIQAPPLMDPHEFRTSQDPLLLWDDMISSYSVRKFDRESDRLPAVSGLAALIEKSTRDQYLAGLWKSRLPAQLLWYVSEPQVSPEQDVPSWSWASIGTACDIHMPKQASCYAQLLASSASELRVRGRVRDMKIALREAKFPEIVKSATGMRVPALAETSDVWATNGKQVLLCRDWRQPILIHLDKEVSLEGLVCLQISYMGLLLLRPVKDGVFKRVGCAQRHRDATFFQDAAEQDVVLV